MHVTNIHRDCHQSLVTFFAIIAGITNLSDASLIGRLGGRMVVISMFMQMITILIGLVFGKLLFFGDMSYMQAGIVASSVFTSHWWY